MIQLDFLIVGLLCSKKQINKLVRSKPFLTLASRMMMILRFKISLSL